MAFITPYSYKGLPETTAAYVRISNISGNSKLGWDGYFVIYADQATKIADPTNFLPDSGFSIHVNYAQGIDPYAPLYIAAMLGFPSSIDA